MDEELDITKLKYVLYARKSTTDETRQVRSIDDQIADCKLFAIHSQLHVVEVLTETQSAKRPGIRPVFRQMINGIKAGKYDGILSWNPDRLARNMLEGGEIIDLIDQGIIKDLKFKTHFFTKDANGKMLLGMAFVLSKQYSDDLSQKVTRGVRYKFSEGKGSSPKHGYIRDDEGYYRPDGKNHELLCKAWQMRRDGTSLVDITEYMVKEGYARVIKKTGAKVTMTKQIISDIFRDPFYYGVLVQAGDEVDLRTIYGFVPACNEDDYNFVQQLTYRRIKPTKPHKNAFYPLRMMVYCMLCKQAMRVGPSSGQTKKYLYYRCDNPDCTRKQKSIRAKVIFDFIYDFLAEGLNLTEADYHQYYDNLTQANEMKREKIMLKIHSLQGSLKQVEGEITERSLGILGLDKKSTIYKVNEHKIDELGLKKDSLDGDIGKLKALLTDPDKDKLTLQQFLNLSKNAVNIVKMGNAIAKDVICRKVFLNFFVDEQKVASYRLKEPFDTMLKHRKILLGRGETVTKRSLFLSTISILSV